MKKITFLRNFIVLVALLVGSGSAMGQGTEDFEAQTALTASYATSSFTNATSGITWSYANARNEDIYGITTKGIMLRYANSYLEATLPNGFGSFSFQYRKAFTGGSERQLELLVNGVQVAVSPTFGTISGAEVDVYDFVYEVNTAGPVTVKIKNVGTGTTNKQTVVDNIVWTAYSSGGNPVVGTPTIQISDGVAKTTDTYFNTAEVTLSSSTDGASIYYTLDGNDPTTSSTLYSAPFNVTTTSTVKALAVKAEMDDSGIASKAITIVAPATATVPYSEAFNNTLGDWYNYEVAGTKPWYASVNGAIANGYGGGDVESWLISPKFTATEDGLALSFNYASKYPGDPILVKVSNDYIGYGSPAAATWTTISTVLAPEVQDDAYAVKSTGNIIHASSGTVYFALVYDAAAAPYSDWRITNASVTLPPEGPVITVTEAEVPAMSAYVDASDSETITVNGVNLTTDITVALGGTDAAQFRLSTSTLAQTDGAVTDASVTIYYEPTDVGSHTATVTLSSTGAESVVKTLSGEATWAPLDAPVATDASGISQTGFTANWNAVAGATEYELSVYTKGAASTSTVLSETFNGFTKGTPDAKANSTDVSSSLDTYTQTSGWTGSKVYEAGGTAKMGGSSSLGYITTPAIDLSANSGSFTVEFDAMAWSGDATEFKIYLDDVLAYTVTGLNNTADYTLSSFSVNLTGGTATSKLRFEGKQSSKGRFFLENLVVKQISGANETQISGSPFKVTDGTSKAIAGLTPSTTYYYTVKAANVNVESAVSNEISVVTSFGTSTDNPTITNIYAHNAKIHFAATAGEKVEVYNAVGQKIISTLAADGQNELPVNAKGVMIVKVGSRLAKVIL